MSASSGREYWVDDKYATRCYKCASKFTFLWRRHHCRQCGQIYCSNCLIVTSKDIKSCLDCHESMKSKPIQQINNRSSLRVSGNFDSSTVITKVPPQTPLGDTCLKSTTNNITVHQIKTSNESATSSTVDNNSNKNKSLPLSVNFNKSSDKFNDFTKVTSIIFKDIPTDDRKENTYEDIAALHARLYREGTLVACPPLQVSNKEADLVVYGMHDVPVATLENPMTLWLEKMLSQARDQVTTKPSVLQKVVDVVERKPYQPFPFVNFRLYETHENAKFFPTSFVRDEIIFPVSVEEVFEAEYSALSQAARKRQSMRQKRSTHQKVIKCHKSGVTDVPSGSSVSTTAITESSDVCINNQTSSSHDLEGPGQLLKKRKEKNRKNGDINTLLDIPPHYSTRVDIILESLQTRCSSNLKARVQILLEELLDDNPEMIYQGTCNDTCDSRKGTVDNGGTSSPFQDPSVSTREGDRGGTPNSNLQQDDEIIAKKEFVLRWTDILCDLTWKLIGQTQFIPRNLLPSRFFEHKSTEDMPHALVYNGIQRHIEQFFIPGGDVSDSQILPGVSFIHSVTTKSNSRPHKNPNVLLLGGHVGRSPILGHTDLVEYCENYEGWLDKLYSRIRTWNPTIILVEETMHHYLQTKIHRDNIVLATTVRRELLEHLERALHGRIVDDLVKVSIADMTDKRMNPCGVCESFTIEEFPDVEQHICSCSNGLQEDISVGYRYVKPKEGQGERDPSYSAVTRTISVLSFTGLPHPTFSTLILRGANSNILKEMVSLLRDKVFVHARHLLNLTHFLIDCCSFVGSEEAASKLLGVAVSITGNHYTQMDLPSSCPRGGYMVPVALKEKTYELNRIESQSVKTNEMYRNEQQLQELSSSSESSRIEMPSNIDGCNNDVTHEKHLSEEDNEEEIEGAKSAKVVSMLNDDVNNVNHAVLLNINNGNGIDCIDGGISLAPSETLTINFGITFSAEALACARQYPGDILQFRDEIEVNIVTIKSDVNQNDEYTVRHSPSRNSKKTRPSRKISMSSGNSSNKDEYMNPLPLVNTSSYNPLFAVFDDGDDYIDCEIRKEYHRERRQYEFYKVKGGDETVQEFLQDIANSDGEFTKLILHEDRKIVMRCVRESTTQQNELNSELTQTRSSSVDIDTSIVCYTACLSCYLQSNVPEGICRFQSCGANVCERGPYIGSYLDSGYHSKPSENSHETASSNSLFRNAAFGGSRRMPAVSERKKVSYHTLSLSLGAFFELLLYANRTSSIIKSSSIISRVGFFSSLCGHPLFTSVRPCFEVYSSEGDSLATISFAVEPLGVHVLEPSPIFMNRSLDDKTVMPSVAPVGHLMPQGGISHQNPLKQHKDESIISIKNCTTTSSLMPQNNYLDNTVNTSLIWMTVLSMCSHNTPEIYADDCRRFRLNPICDPKSMVEISKGFAYNMGEYWSNNLLKSNKFIEELSTTNNVKSSFASSTSEGNVGIHGIDAVVKYAIEQSNNFRNSIREQYHRMELMELKGNVLYLISCMKSLGYSHFYLPRPRTESIHDALVEVCTIKSDVNSNLSVGTSITNTSANLSSSVPEASIIPEDILLRKDTARPDFTKSSPTVIEKELLAMEEIHVSTDVDSVRSGDLSPIKAATGCGESTQSYNSSGTLSLVSPSSPLNCTLFNDGYLSSENHSSNQPLSQTSNSNYQGRVKLDDQSTNPTTSATVQHGPTTTTEISITEAIYITPKRLLAMLENVTTLERGTLFRTHILIPCVLEVVHHYYNTVQGFISLKKRLVDSEQGAPGLESKDATVGTYMPPISIDYPKALVRPAVERLVRLGDDRECKENFNNREDSIDSYTSTIPLSNVTSAPFNLKSSSAKTSTVAEQFNNLTIEANTKIELGKLKSQTLAYSPKYDTYLRLEEPTSLILLALKSTMAKKVGPKNIYTCTSPNISVSDQPASSFTVFEKNYTSNMSQDGRDYDSISSYSDAEAVTYNDSRDPHEMGKYYPTKGGDAPSGCDDNATAGSTEDKDYPNKLSSFRGSTKEHRTYNRESENGKKTDIEDTNCDQTDIPQSTMSEILLYEKQKDITTSFSIGRKRLHLGSQKSVVRSGALSVKPTTSSSISILKQLSAVDDHSRKKIVSSLDSGSTVRSNGTNPTWHESIVVRSRKHSEASSCTSDPDSKPPRTNMISFSKKRGVPPYHSDIVFSSKHLERNEQTSDIISDPFVISSYDHAIDVLFGKSMTSERLLVFTDTVLVNDDSHLRKLRDDVDSALLMSNSSGKQGLIKLKVPNVGIITPGHSINETVLSSPVKPSIAPPSLFNVTLNIQRKLLVTVELLYPHHFAALRYLHSGGYPEDILVSFLRCKEFTPSSGQSNKRGKTFFKTADERYILKEVKHAELKHFEAFGPSYFRHMGMSFTEERDSCEEYVAAATGKSKPIPTPRRFSTSMSSCFDSRFVPGSIRTLLVKTLGVYSVNVTDPAKKSKVKGTKFFILMTNLSYNRNIQRSFDLKGSQVNRLASYDRRSIYMDSNMCARMRNGYFFYVREEEKSLIKRIAERDSRMLSEENIMDYSIIVGVEHSRLENQLSVIEESYINNSSGVSLASYTPIGDVSAVKPSGALLPSQGPLYPQLPTLSFGIIDYIHPFNFHKLMESHLKQRFNQFTGEELPTILEPHDYKQRFDRYTDQYFCGVPSKLSSYSRTRALHHTSVFLPHNHNAFYSCYGHGSTSLLHGNHPVAHQQSEKNLA